LIFLQLQLKHDSTKLFLHASYPTSVGIIGIYSVWAVGCGLWAVGRGPWAVGCGLWAIRHGARAGWSIWIWVFVFVCEYVLDALSHLLMQLDSVFRKGGFWFREPPWGCGLWAVGCGLWANMQTNKKTNHQPSNQPQTKPTSQPTSEPTKQHINRHNIFVSLSLCIYSKVYNIHIHMYVRIVVLPVLN